MHGERCHITKLTFIMPTGGDGALGGQAKACLKYMKQAFACPSSPSASSRRLTSQIEATVHWEGVAKARPRPLPFISAFLTQSLYDIFWLDNSKVSGNRNLRNHDVVQADGLVAFDARQVNVSQMMEFMFAFFLSASAQAILLFAGAIINMVKDVVFCKQGQCTIDGRCVHIRYFLQNVRKRESTVHGFMQGLDDKQTIRCQANPCLS